MARGICVGNGFGAGTEQACAELGQVNSVCPQSFGIQPLLILAVVQIVGYMCL